MTRGTTKDEDARSDESVEDERARTGSVTEQEAGPAILGKPPELDPDPGGEPAPSNEPAKTRERILDVALELFVEQGFDGTSLRQIAAQVGVTKAALYYHFASKNDILMALHMRLHEFGREAIESMGSEPVTLEAWGMLLDDLMAQMTAQRNLFLLHERNPASFEKLHRKDHLDEDEDLQARFRTILADTRVPLRDRVRIAGSFGVVFAGLFLVGDAFSSSGDQELLDLLRDAVHDVLRG